MIDKKYPIKVVLQNINKHLIPNTQFQGNKFPCYAIVGMKFGNIKVNIESSDTEKKILVEGLSLNEIKQTQIYVKTIQYTPYASNNMIKNRDGTFTREIRLRGEDSIILCELPKEIPLCTENKNGYEFIIDISGFTPKNQYGDLSFLVKIVPIEIDFAAELEKERIAQANKPFDWREYFRNKPKNVEKFKNF